MSYWHDSAPDYPGGREGWLPKKVEVAVIGGGLAGLLTAYLLGEAGIDTVVLERRALGEGQTGNTTGKITCQTGLIYRKLENTRGASDARLYAEAQTDAITSFRNIIESERIACDLERLPAILYTRENPALLEEEAVSARRAGIRAELKRRTALPFDIAAALAYPGQAQFHPIKFLMGIATRVKLYQGLGVVGVHGRTILTDDGQEMEAEKIVFACHYPFKNLPGMFFTRLHQSISYGIAVSGIPPLDGMYYGIDPDGISMRSHGNVLLMIGGGHRTGEWGKNPDTGLRVLEEAAERYYPRPHIISRWAGQDCMPPDGLPLIGEYSPLRPNWFVATGFCKWGMTGSMIAAKVIRDKILGKRNPVEKIVRPSRFGGDTLRAMGKETGYAVSGLSKRIFLPPAEVADELAPGTAGVVFRGREKTAAYRDPAGKLHTTSPYCTHMGCELAWNPDTKTWDCPCHGSRFSPDGKVLDAPAVKPLVSGQDPSDKTHERKPT